MKIKIKSKNKSKMINGMKMKNNNGYKQKK